MNCLVDGCTSGGRLKRGLCNKHYQKMRTYGDPLTGKERVHKQGEGCISGNGYHQMCVNGKHITKHRLIVEKVLGHKIPIGTDIHHVDGNKSNNNNSNLVLCESRSYHFILHRRTNALKSCGHANWRICQHCRKYDNPENNMWVSNTKAFHRECGNLKRKEYRDKKI